MEEAFVEVMEEAILEAMEEATEQVGVMETARRVMMVAVPAVAVGISVHQRS